MGVLGNLHAAYHFLARRISRKGDREIRAAIIGIPLIHRLATPTIQALQCQTLSNVRGAIALD